MAHLSPEILYEDEDMLALNKPSGFVVHGDGKTKEFTLSDWILEKYPSLKDVGEPWFTPNKVEGKAPNGEIIVRPGIVHRLDRDTSGVLLIAKTAGAFEYLKKQFQEKKIKKTYRAFVYGKVKNDTGVITKPIGRSTGDFRKRSAEFGARGSLRDAVTEYRVIKKGEEATLVEVYPKTGRTHQIRVHMKAIGHPLVSDALYAPKGKPLFGFTRTALHAFFIDLVSPRGRALHIEAPTPEDFITAEKILTKNN